MSIVRKYLNSPLSVDPTSYSYVSCTGLTKDVKKAFRETSVFDQIKPRSNKVRLSREADYKNVITVDKRTQIISGYTVVPSYHVFVGHKNPYTTLLQASVSHTTIGRTKSEGNTKITRKPITRNIRVTGGVYGKRRVQVLSYN
jgi:hypothetical protein